MGKYYEHKKTKSGYLICAVPSCRTKKSTTTLKTFEFPSDLKRRSQWISAIVDATLKNEEETSSLDDLYALENKRIELEMEISSVLGDHSYVCARHFRPEDITVHTHVCRLTSNAVPSVFKNYSIELPRQFFKKICQAAKNIQERTLIDDIDNLIKVEDRECTDDIDSEAALSGSEDTFALDERATKELNSIVSSPSHENHLLDDDEDDDVVEEMDEIIHDMASEEDYVYDIELGSPTTESKFPLNTSSSESQAKLRKRLRNLEVRHGRMKKRLLELENKHILYNLDAVERDAANKNEEALFLLDMLKTYTLFEHTRKEILSGEADS